MESALSVRHSAWAPLLAAALWVLGSGPSCATSCDDAVRDPPEAVTDGTTDDSGSFYESAPWEGAYLKFPPQKRYDFMHGLGDTPDLIQVYVGFTKTPLGDDGQGNISLAVGNEAIIEEVNDEYVRVRNDTCETFYVRLVAGITRDADPSQAGAGGGS